MQTDGHTDRHDEAKSRFLRFCEHTLKMIQDRDRWWAVVDAAMYRQVP
jgi:hypothetical protein